MSLRNYADIRRIGRHQSCPRLASPTSIGISLIEPKPLHITSSSSSSSSSSRPLLLVTGTQIQRNDHQPALGATSTRRPATRHYRRYSSTGTGNNIGLNNDVRIQLPRLNHACENGVCSTAPSVDDVVSTSSLTCNLATSVASSDCLVRRHQRFGTDDIDVQSVRPLFNQDRGCSLRRLDSASTGTLAEHEHLPSSFNVKTFTPKLKSSVKSKPDQIKRLSSFPELAPRLSCGEEDRLVDRNAEQGKISDSVSVSSLKEEEPNFVKNERCCKWEEKSRNAAADLDSQCSKLQDAYLKSDIVTHVDKLRAFKLQSIHGDVSEQMAKDKDESQALLQQRDSSEEMVAMAMAKMSEEFHSVWPQLLRRLVEESINDFESMDQHMKICMAELLSDNNESHPSDN